MGRSNRAKSVVSKAIAKYARMSEEDQFRAVAWGNKPMCSVSQKHETSLPYLELEVVVDYNISGREGSYTYPEYLYYKRGLSVEAKRAAYLLVKKKTKREHSELGKLLGYSKDEIDAWVKEQSNE